MAHIITDLRPPSAHGHGHGQDDDRVLDGLTG